METVGKIFEYVMSLMGNIVKVLIMLAVVGVIWGILKYFFSYNPEKRKEANKFIVYGLLSLLVITSIWGFVHLFGTFFGLKLGQTSSGDFYKSVGTYQEGEEIDATLQFGEPGFLLGPDDTSFTPTNPAEGDSGAEYQSESRSSMGRLIRDFFKR